MAKMLSLAGPLDGLRLDGRGNLGALNLGGGGLASVVAALAWDYVWDFSESTGRAVPNSGAKAASQPVPDLQLIGASGAAMDGDGGTANTKLTWPSGVANGLGLDECVVLTFTASNQIHYLHYKFNFPSAGLTPINVTAALYTRLAAGSSVQPIILGSNHVSAGERVEFTPGATTALYTVAMANLSDASVYGIAIRPGTGATFPFSIVIEAAIAVPTGQPIPTLQEWRDNRLAGHARALFGAPNAVPVTGHTWQPNLKSPVLNVDLSGEPVTSLHMSYYAKFDRQSYFTSTNFVLGFQKDERPGVDFDNYGSVGYNTESTDIEYFERLIGSAGGNTNIAIQDPPDTILADYGWHRIDVIAGPAGSAADARNLAQQYDTDPTRSSRYEVYVNGIEQTDTPELPFPAEATPRLLNIGGVKEGLPDPATLLAEGAFPGPIALPRIRVNRSVMSSAEIFTEMQADIAGGKAQIDAPLFHVVTEGDSTSRFSGAPPHWYARELAGPRRMFTNTAQGGKYFKTAPLDPDDIDNAFNTPRNIGFRKAIFEKTVALGCPLTIAMYLGGENNPTHLNSPSPAEALADLKALVPAEASLYADTTHKIVPVLQTVRPSGSGGPTTVTNIAKADFNAYLRSLFTVTTANPYLFGSSDIALTGFAWMIDLDIWQPRYDATTYSDWYACLADQGPGHTNPILNGDYQHWAGTDGGRYAAIDVYTPAITLIAAANGVTL